jgi:hypothetical protein
MLIRYDRGGQELDLHTLGNQSCPAGFLHGDEEAMTMGRKLDLHHENQWLSLGVMVMREEAMTVGRSLISCMGAERSSTRHR